MCETHLTVGMVGQSQRTWGTTTLSRAYGTLKTITEAKVKGKVLPVFNYAARHEDVLAEWRHSSTYS